MSREAHKPWEPWGTVRRERPFSASHLHLFHTCVLRLLFESERFRPALPPSPVALLGTAIHEFLESQRKPTDHDWSELTAQLLDGRIAVRSSAFPGTAIAFADVLPVRSLLRRVGRIKARWRARSNPSLHHAMGARRGAIRSRVVLEKFRTGRTMALRGKPDRVEITETGAVEVTEFKSGRIFREGRVEPSYLLQLLSYGEIVSETEDADVSLRLVGPDGEYRTDYGATQRTQLQGFVSGLERTLPAGADLLAEHLATPGDGCRNCAFRPGCSRYLASAPTAWRERQPISTPPMDRWGTIQSVHDDPSGLRRIYLTNPTGGLYCVRGVPRAVSDRPLEAGKAVWFFNLRAGEPGAGRIPINFYIADVNSPRDSAHAAAVYVR
jgi:hypothetical protein